MEIINGKAVALKICEQTKKDVKDFKNKFGRNPKLVAILVGENPASKIYVNSKQKKCAELGIESDVVLMPKKTTQNKIISTIKKLNKDDSVDGILLQLPLPLELDSYEIINHISPNKDVDGLTNINLGKIASGDTTLAPCTAKGVLKLLETENLEGKNAVVIGRSLLVGKPTAMLLTEKNATVTLCHSRTKDLQKHISNADILVVAVGKPKFVNKVKTGAVVIDVGINRTEDGLVGDVDFEKVSMQASKITPVPGGVGPLTIAMLMQNTVICANKNMER